jgi:integrase/recombinase XerD
MIQLKTPIKISGTTRLLSAPEFQDLAMMPREVEWLKNIRKPSTKRAYENAIKDFMVFTGIKRPEEFRLVTRAHVVV